MSVYSGFATRQQETLYNKLVEKGINVMIDKILHCYTQHGKLLL